MHRMRLVMIVCVALAAAGGWLQAQNKYSAPQSIVHVVTIKWKADSTPEQRKAALEGVKKMAGQIPGINRVWIKATKVQPSSYNDAFVIEFANRAAADAYADHAAHREWEKSYLAIREQSTSHQITN